MQLSISAICVLGKKMSVKRDKADAGDDEVISCQITVRGIRVQRDTMDELSGVPIGCTSMLYSDLGAPFQAMSFLLPKRVLMATGKIRHSRALAKGGSALALKGALVRNVRFNLDQPDEHGPTASWSFTLHWRAAGDEVDDVRHLLGQECQLDMLFKEEPGTQPMFPDKPARGAGDNTSVRVTGPGFDSGEVKMSELKAAVRSEKARRAAKAADKATA